MAKEATTSHRDASLDCLRVLAAVGVVILHFSTSSNGALKYVSTHSPNYYFLLLSCAVFCPAVNIFILLSGYFGIDRTQIKWTKVLYILSMTIIVRIFFYVLSIGLGKESFEIAKFIRVLMPINYYIILYLTLYILSPYINMVLLHLNHEQYRRLVFIVVCLFSIWTFGIDCLKQFIGGDLLNPLSTVSSNGSNGGYTLVNFVMLYIIGGYIKKYPMKLKRKWNALMLLLCTIIIFVISIVNQKVWNYNNPMVILSAISFLSLFSASTFNSFMISKLSSATLACYLIHVYILEYMDMENWVGQNLMQLIFTQLIFALLAFLISYLFTIIFDNCMGYIIRKSSDKNL